MKHITISVLLSLSVALYACGDTDNVTLSGADIGLELCQGFCSLGPDCGLFPPNEVGICVDACVQGFCDEFPDCEKRFELNATEWDACVDALYTSDCANVELVILPAECQVVDGLF